MQVSLTTSPSREGLRPGLSLPDMEWPAVLSILVTVTPPTASFLSADLCSYDFAFFLPCPDFLHVFSLLDRVVDDLNPMLNFTRKEVENLLHFVEKEPAPQGSLNVKGIKEPVLQLACLKYPHLITKVRTWYACRLQASSFQRGRLVWQACFLRLNFCFTQATSTQLVFFLVPCVPLPVPSLVL